MVLWLLGLRWRRALGSLRVSAALGVALLLLGLSACTTLPQIDRAALASEAIGLSPASNLGRIASGYRPAPDQSGFRLMPLGSFSLGRYREAFFETVSRSLIFGGDAEVDDCWHEIAKISERIFLSVWVAAGGH